jgi:hypothetical protein
MVTVHVPVVELLCFRRQQEVFQQSSTCYQVRGGACGHVLSYHTLNVTAFRGPGSRGAYPVLKSPERGWRELGCVLSRGDNDLPWADR